VKALKDISNIYLVGIGGIGMSALARYFKKQQKKVVGYDKTRTDLTDALIEEGIEVYYEDNIDALDQSAELVIHTPAIPPENYILSYYKKNNYTVYKRSEILQQITKDYKTIAIAGTHGKTTITALCSWITHCSGLDATSFIGGICTNYNSNFIYGEGEYVIVEADEYDRSFLKLQPNIAVISALDADHLDVYQTYDKLNEAYNQFAATTYSNGKLLVHHYISNKIKNYNYTYAVKDEFNEEASGQLTFNLNLNGQVVEDIRFNLPGLHNVENATAAAALAFLTGASLENIKKGLCTFKGIKRRFEYIINTPSFVIIDDYAHHPVELGALIQSAKTLYPKREISIIFQPHLYSRTKDFAQEFAASLSQADEVILLPIYPARELPIEGVSSTSILQKIKNTKVTLCEKGNLIKELSKRKTEILLIAGAGDIDQLIPEVKAFYQTKKMLKR